MAMKTTKPELKHFGKPDEVRTFPRGKLELVHVGGDVVGLATFEPGWKWSESIKPIVNTKSCQAPHFGYQVSGTMMIKFDDGTQLEMKPGDVAMIPPGHDAWVVGDDPVVLVDFQGMAEYALKKAA